MRAISHRGAGPVFLAVLLLAAPALGRAPQSIPDDAVAALNWRNVGPSRGGRVTAVAGIPGDPLTYYMGATGGGVWRTQDGGQSWRNVSDGFLGTGSVGAIAVAPSHSRVLYVGMGESPIRGNTSHGDGVYRSRDGARSFEAVGLSDTQQIAKIQVHPEDPDTLWVAALGHVWGPNEERGVFKSTDGGDSWRKVLFVDENTGACDLALDPQDPRTLFAATWQVGRSAWSLDSGGPGSALYRSRDGGETWTKLGRGLPAGPLGRIGVAVSPLDSNRVWAIVEAENGGVYRSDDGGDSFRLTNSERDLRQRAWYYTKIYADTEQVDTVYVLNVRFHKSQDGGRTFDTTLRTPHGDNHDLWIAPEDSRRMVEGNDGGATVTFDGGQSWSSLDNQPTAQFYRVAVDTQHPYRIYGAQQDNSTVSISSEGGGRRGDDFYDVGGGESGFVVPRTDDPNIVYAGSYGGYLTRYDHATGKMRNVMVWPENPMGWGADALAERFQWNFPIHLSPHDPNVLYVASQHVWRTDDEGVHWKRISPDLTTDDASKQGPSGGPITKDNTGIEYYCTIFALAESPVQAGVLWAGSDDGKVHVTRDGGESWSDVTPLDLPKWAQVNAIDPSPHDAGTAWVAVTAYKQDDFTPYVFHTDDFGATWSLRTEGIPRHEFVRVVREDPVRPGLVYAGTELGAHVSADGGEHWQPLQRNLPHVPVTDLVVKGDDLVAATQGRAFWILGELDLLRQWTPEISKEAIHVFAPAVAERGRGEAVVRILCKDAPPKGAVLEVLDASGTSVRRFESAAGGRTDDAGANESGAGRRFGPRRPEFRLRQGLGEFRWDLRLENAVEVPGAVLWGGDLRGPMVVPGAYTVRLTIGDEVHETALSVIGDPNLSTTAEEYQAQFDLLLAIRDEVSRVHRAVLDLRAVREQARAMVAHAKGLASEKELGAAVKALEEALQPIEDALIQSRSQSSQDPLNYPIQLNNKMAALAGTISSDYGPGEQHHVVFAALKSAIDEQVAALDAVLDTQGNAFNELVQRLEVPAIVRPSAAGSSRDR